MSMLAERKQKQRWSLNPRGKHWSEDVNKFGHKMLEKMGWSAGKGLGANLDGITEHVKVSYKNDAKGMGFKDNGEQWTKHEDNFTSLLANLGSGSEAKQITLPTLEKSLEKKSQASRARVHYKKFTRGKDLAHRSEKDIANIFGRKTLERPEVRPKESKEDVSENGAEDKSYGVVTIKAGNMTEYFKSKLGKIGNFSSSKGDYALESQDDYESEIGACTGFGFASVTENKDDNDTPSLGINKINFVSSQNDKTDETTEEKTIKKRKRDSEDSTEVEPKKKKKSKKKQMAFDNLGSDINPAEEVCYDNPCLKQTDTPQRIESNDEKGKKKRVTFSSPINEVLNKSDDSNKTEKTKKKKKKKQLTNGIDNLGCEDNSFEESNQLSNKENEKKTKKKKKRSIDNDENSINVTQAKKKKKHEEVGIDNLACEEISVNEKNEEIKRYKLKKKAMEHGLVNPACEANSPPQEPIKKKKKSKENILDNSEENSISEDTKVQKKKNKKQKNNSFEISHENVSDVSQNDDGAKIKKKKNKVTEENSVESSPKKSKKKNKSKESGIENLGCEINTVEENIASINSEIDSYQTELENELNVKKAKKHKKRDTENPEKGQIQNSPNENSKNNTISDNEQSTNDETNFQDSKFNQKPFGNKNSGQETIDNTFENRNNGFGNRNNQFGNRNNQFGNRHSFDNRNSHFNNPQNRFNNGSFNDRRGSNNFNRSFNYERSPNNFNRSFNDQRSSNNYNRPFNNQNGPWKPKFNPDKVDKSSLKHILKPGELQLSFTGSNITKIMGYGVGTDLINVYRPEPEATTETTKEM